MDRRKQSLNENQIMKRHLSIFGAMTDNLANTVSQHKFRSQSDNERLISQINTEFYKRNQSTADGKPLI